MINQVFLTDYYKIEANIKLILFDNLNLVIYYIILK